MKVTSVSITSITHRKESIGLSVHITSWNKEFYWYKVTKSKWFEMVELWPGSVS